jgi:ribosomal-protein-alanine N-acetyltransferase
MMTKEFLITAQQIMLREVKMTDAEQIFSAMICPEIHSMHSNGFNTIDDVRRYIPVLTQEYNKGIYRTLAIAEKVSNGLCGTITIDVHKYFSRAEIGYWISIPHRDKGYASEAVRAIIRHGLSELKLKRIQAVHSIENPASGRVLEKAGMKYEGTLRLYNGSADEKMYSAIQIDIGE